MAYNQRLFGGWTNEGMSGQVDWTISVGRMGGWLVGGRGVDGWMSGCLAGCHLDHWKMTHLICHRTFCASLLSQLLHPFRLGGFSKANILCPESLLGLVLSILPHILYVLTSFNHCNSVECFHALSFIDEETGA